MKNELKELGMFGFGIAIILAAFLGGAVVVGLFIRVVSAVAGL